MSNIYRFRVHRTGAQNSNGAGFTRVLFDTKESDPNNNFASNVYTVPVDGDYQFNFCIHYSVNNTVYVASVFKNGVEVIRGSRGRGSTCVTGSAGSDLLPCLAGDVLEVKAYSDVAVALDTVGPYNNYFSGFLVSV